MDGFFVVFAFVVGAIVGVAAGPAPRVYANEWALGEKLCAPHNGVKRFVPAYAIGKVEVVCNNGVEVQGWVKAAAQDPR